MLCFSNRGQVYWLKVHQLPQAGRNARGKPMVNLLPLEEGEKINAVLPVKQYDEQHFVFMATSQGTVKKTPLDAFSRPRCRAWVLEALAGVARYTRRPWIKPVFCAYAANPCKRCRPRGRTHARR